MWLARFLGNLALISGLSWKEARWNLTYYKHDIIAEYRRNLEINANLKEATLPIKGKGQANSRHFTLTGLEVW